MKLENLTVCYTHPCIMDVKVGCITYDKFADDEKIKRELTKCPALKEICFQLVGMKVIVFKLECLVIKFEHGV